MYFSSSSFSPVVTLSLWGTTNVEIQAPSAENPELSKLLLMTRRIEHSMHASPAARNSSLLTSIFPAHSAVLFTSSSFLYLLALGVTDAVSRVGPWNRIGHLAHRQRAVGAA